MGRAMGETMAVMMVTGNAAVIPEPITNIFSPIRTITGSIGIEMGETPTGSLHFHALFALALILLFMVLAVNLIAGRIMKNMREKQYGRAKRGRVKLPENIRKYMKFVLIAVLIISMLWVVYSWLGLLVTGGLFAAFILSYAFGDKIPLKYREMSAYSLLTASIVIVLFFLAVIFYDIFSNGLGAISWEFLTQSPRDMGRAGGIFPAIVGTIYLVLGAIGISLPLGVAAAIYLNEYTGESRMKDIIRVGVENLNGTPSIVFGLFGYSFIVIYLHFGVSLIAGQITLAFMVLPTIIMTTEEALKTVPMEMREASLAMGATRWKTITKVVLPSAIPSVITGTILAIGRTAGETAPILFTAAVFTQRHLASSPFDPVMALPYHLFVLTTSVPGGKENAYGTAVVLLTLVILMYGVAIAIRAHYNRKRRY